MYRILYNEKSIKSVNLPSSKSITHRALILGALNSGRTEITNPLISEDTIITRDALISFGAGIETGKNKFVITHPIGKVQNDNIFLGNSGSSARFLIPLVSHLDKPVTFTGSPELHKRPFSQLFDILRQMGMTIESENNSLPATIYPSEKQFSGEYILKSLPSSQIVSGIMMAAAKGEKPVSLIFKKRLPSFPYIKITQKMMSNFGLNVHLNSESVSIKPEPINYDWNYRCEQDMSAASYWCAYSLINKTEISFPNLRMPTMQGDEEIFLIAEKLGAEIQLFKNKVVINGNITSGLDWDCEAIPDIVPTLAVIGMFAPEPFVLRNVKNLQYKESNRIKAIEENVKSLGGKAIYQDGTLTLFPSNRLHGGIINSFNDHRIAMSFALAGTRIDGVIIDNPDCVSKSYPDFWNDFTEWELQNDG